MKDDDVRQTILEVEEIKLKAQLRAVREAIKGEKQVLPEDGEKRMSQIEYVYQLLRVERKPLHVTEIIDKCREKYDLELYRESIVSALLKKVNRMDRFIKTDPNTFGLSEYRELYRSKKQEG
jgi:hypothetical protein